MILTRCLVSLGTLFGSVCLALALPDPAARLAPLVDYVTMAMLFLSFLGLDPAAAVRSVARRPLRLGLLVPAWTSV